MKKILSVLLVLSMLVCIFSSCIKESKQDESTSEIQETSDTDAAVDNSETTAPHDLEYTEYDIVSNKDKIHVQGRSIDTSSGISADWSASGIEFNATYTGIISVTGEAASKDVMFRVYVNGKETGSIIFTTTTSTKKLPGTKSDEQTTANIRLVRVQYVKDGLVTLKTVKLSGNIHTWQEERKFIEFIGDSITCGYGSITNDDQKDGSRTFAYVAACELGIDYSMVAISGIGVNKSTSQHSGGTIGDFYKYNTWYRSKTKLYEPEKKADLVVVNLNTNDNSKGATKNAYKQDLKALLTDIRSIHGENVSIVWIVGQMTDVDTSVNGWLVEVFEELGGESAGLYIMETTKNNQGGRDHPNYNSHKVTAGHLVTFIEEKNLLG